MCCILLKHEKWKNIYFKNLLVLEKWKGISSPDPYLPSLDSPTLFAPFFNREVENEIKNLLLRL